MAKKRDKALELFPETAEEAAQSGSSIAGQSPLAPDRAASPGNAGFPGSGGAPPTPPTPHGDLRGKTVFVIDSHSLIYQVFHAIPEMTSPDGRPVNALFGFLRDLLDILGRHQPDFLVCAFDHSEETFRNGIYPEYKAHRDPMPEALREQIPWIRELLQAMGIPAVELPGFEADDILATFARETVEQGAERCVLVTSDKDCRQLLSGRVRLLNLRKGNLYGPEQLLEDWGVTPAQVIDFQSLVGDTVDNVPGVQTIGPKTATQLLAEFGSLEGVLANIPQIKGKKAEKLAECAELARISYRLVRLDDRVPLTFDWKQACVGQWNLPEAVELCNRHGFRSLTDRVAKLGPASTTADSGAGWQADYRTVSSLEELAEIVAKARSRRTISLDTETTSTNPNWAELVGVSLCIDPGQAWYVPVRAPAGAPTFSQDQVVGILRPLLDDPEVELVGQNIKYDLIVLRWCGLRMRNRLFDTMVADYLADPGRNTHNLDELSSRLLGHQTMPISDLIGSGKNQGRMDEVALEKITWYAAEDADVPVRLRPILQQRLEESELTGLFRDVEMPLVPVLAEMEFNGICVDGPLLGRISEEFRLRMLDLQEQIWEAVGCNFNVDSPKQLAEVLFDRLGLKEIRKTKTGRSTDADVLEELAELHVLPRMLMEYRQLAKLKSTYADALASQINPRTGRVHTSFLQDVARTGRLSSKDPNLQNIPVRTAEGRRIRQAFVARSPEHCLVAADWSQIELRMLAHFCQDANMLRAFRADEDIHQVVAAQVNGVPLGQVTSDMRRQAKAINFGIIYGQSPWGLARELGISKEEAAAFIDAYFARYPAVDGFLRQVLDQAASLRYVTTILGRRRPVEGVRHPGPGPLSRNRTAAERVAVNTVIQGSAADLIKLAMIRVHERLGSSGLDARLLLQIHDELLFESARECRSELAALIHAEMVSVGNLQVPLRVVIESGANWNDTEELAGPWNLTQS